MGCFSSRKADAKWAELSLERDIEKIHEYLMGRSTIEDLWMQCNSNFDYKVDMEEFREMLYHSQIYFARMFDPLNKTNPERESLEGKISELSKRFNANNDQRISKAEFKKYGEYLFEEKDKLMKVINVSLTVSTKEDE